MDQRDGNNHFPGTPGGVVPRVDVRKDKTDFGMPKGITGAPINKDPHGAGRAIAAGNETRASGVRAVREVQRRGR